MAWDIEVVDGCAVVRMNTNKVNVQNNHFFADLHGAFDRLFQYPRPTVGAVNGHAIARGLITALDCDFRVVARKPARFGLNEVRIGIPMPAVYVEIIKYALGDQIGALAALRGKLYELDEAARRGFFHEVV
jgi:enoyl-CoA hydratase